MKKYLVGIDEVGRGSIAGPVSVGLVFIEKKNYKSFLIFYSFLNDSKKLSNKERLKFFKILKEDKKIELVFASRNSKIIDSNGINPVIQSIINKSLNGFLNKKNIKADDLEILLDGGLKAQAKFRFQKTIIRGDVSEKLISAASIWAKVKRDEKMNKLAKKFKNYFLEINKGYGTKKHFECLMKYGLIEIHRQTFLKKL